MPAVMTPYRSAFLVLVALSFVACGNNGPPEAATAADTFVSPLVLADEGPIVARVNGVPIHEAWVTTMARGRNLDLNDPAQRTRAIDELVEYAVLSQAAKSQPELANDATRAEIELNALSARASSVMARVGAAVEPDESALRAEYDQQVSLNGDREYEVSHLLFADEAVALEAAGEAAGKPFAEVQAAYKDRARQSVDLGWIKLGQVPPEFGAALGTLAAGSTTAAPVQTAYGWHVIHLRETRPFAFPKFEDVREGIRRMLVAKTTRDAVDALKSKATIEIVAQ